MNEIACNFLIYSMHRYHCLLYRQELNKKLCDNCEENKMSIISELTCPYINKIKAGVLNTNYYCDFDHMEFEEMTAHCKHCEMYENLMKRAEQLIRLDNHG